MARRTATRSRTRFLSFSTSFRTPRISENLDDDQRGFVVERFVAVDIFNRIYLDVGKAVQDKAPTSAVALSRLRAIKDYVRETVASVFRRIPLPARLMTARRTAAIVNQTIQETFQVFEGFL